MEALSGVKGDNSVKIIGPDLDELEVLADEDEERSATDPRDRERGHLPHPRPVAHGVPRRSRKMPAVGRLDGRRQQRGDTAPWVRRPCRQMIEGEKRFDITLRWPKRCAAAKRRSSIFPSTSSTTRSCRARGRHSARSAARHRPGRSLGVGSQVPTPTIRSVARRRGCGCAIWSRRSAMTARPSPRASSSVTARRRSIASRASG